MDIFREPNIFKFPVRSRLGAKQEVIMLGSEPSRLADTSNAVQLTLLDCLKHEIFEKQDVPIGLLAVLAERLTCQRTPRMSTNPHQSRHNSSYGHVVCHDGMVVLPWIKEAWD